MAILRIPPLPKIDFMRWRWIAMGISATLMLLSVLLLATRGLTFGLDFTGGTLVELEYSDTVSPARVRGKLAAAGFDDVLVVSIGSDREIMVKAPGSDSVQVGDSLVTALRAGEARDIKVHRVDFVGSQVGDELRDQGGKGMLLALAVVMLYVAFRFQFKFGIGALVALLHDVLITLGIFSLMRRDFDLAVLAAVLAVIGYSINDTIVVSDRIRENFRKMRRTSPTEVINTSLNQTMARTLITSATTLLVVLAALLLGGEQVRGISLALLIGVVVGTYSSIYVAASVLLSMNIDQRDLAVPEKEGADTSV